MERTSEGVLGTRARESDTSGLGGVMTTETIVFSVCEATCGYGTVSWVPYPGVAVRDGLGNLFIRVLFVPVFILEARNWKSSMEGGEQLRPFAAYYSHQGAAAVQ